ncbi:hypothetical protein Glove_199g117 [Diversispora epigaea]|uniref:CCHC-type domain-containing protein n=1 Tax=Diversispora epigaea TaxID=1348612 RepID=A0A397IK46_9GLOM|nr:hypothetical protein Glove_199g117 [Diversispora epigaea]
MAHEGADQLDLENENANLKEDLYIAGLIIIALQVRHLILMNRGYALWQEANNRARCYRLNFFKRKPSKSFTPITFKYLQHKRNIYEGYWYRKSSFLLIKRNTPENNSLNMATVARDLTSISPLIADFKNYSEQIPPDEWYQARFIVWLRHKYQTETVGIQQVATQRLAQEKFLPFNTPETYETRIRPLLLGVANNDANILGLLKGYLSGDLYTWMRSDNPTDINAFFSSLKNMWLERRPSPSYGSQIPQVSTVSEQPSNTVSALITSEEIDRKIQMAVALENQKNESNKIRFDPNLSLNNTDSDSSFFQNLMNVMKDISNRLSSHKITASGKGKKNNSSSSDDIDVITKGMAELSLNLVKTSKVIKKSLRGCSNCNKVGHIFRTCPKKKKSRQKAHVNHINKNDSSDSENDSSDSDLGSSSSSEESEAESDYSFDSFEPKFSSIRPAHVEKLPPIQDNIYREPIPEIPESDGEEETLDDPIEIDFVQRRDPATDIATAEYKIKRLIIPAAGLDSCANFSIMTENIAKRVKLVIDIKEKHDLSGIATIHTESIGFVRNVPVTFAPGCTIHSDFAVVKYHKPMLILPNTLLDKYDYDLLASKRVLKLVCNGKEHFIPVNMHPVKNKLEVNCITASQGVKPLVSDQISQETNRSEDNNIPLEEWHAPDGFRLDSDNSTLKKNA